VRSREKSPTGRCQSAARVAALQSPFQNRERKRPAGDSFTPSHTITKRNGRHHGDGIVAVVRKVAPGDNARLTASQTGRFYMPAYVGPKGWVALRLDSGEIDWDEVAELVSDSYRRIAPKHLASQVKLST
jgi:hypothetical protein